MESVLKIGVVTLEFSVAAIDSIAATTEDIPVPISVSVIESDEFKLAAKFALSVIVAESEDELVAAMLPESVTVPLSLPTKLFAPTSFAVIESDVDNVVEREADSVALAVSDEGIELDTLLVSDAATVSELDDVTLIALPSVIEAESVDGIDA